VHSDSGQAFTGALDPATVRILPSSHVTHVHLVRHGDVEGMKSRVVRGQLDTPLSAHGIEQGHALVRWMTKRERRPTVIETSDLVRCSSLADELAHAWGVDARRDVRLREQSMGAWEGRTWADISTTEASAVTAYWDDYRDARPTRGESFADVQRRVGAWWDERASAFAGGRVVVVTHVGVIRALVCRWLGVDGAEALRFAPATASITSFQLGEAGAVLGVFGERPWLYARASSASTGVDPSRPRIALSGSAGTGKTTLGRRLARELGVPFLEEGMRTRLERGFDVHGMRAGDWQRLVAELWNEQREREDAETGGFVADRSSLDYAAFWLHYGLHEADGPTEEFLASRFEDARRYDRIFLFPWGALPLVDDGVRSTNRWTQLRFQSVLEGLVERYAPENVTRVSTSTDLDERLRLALEAWRSAPTRADA
jgi:broad specificity phosphatase PhoE/nicotinamide riboside kinase